LAPPGTDPGDAHTGPTRSGPPRGGPARHEVPDIDAAALAAAVFAERAYRTADELGIDRWAGFLEPFPERLRDAPVQDLRLIARQVRAAYGPRDSIRDALPAEATEPLLDAVDRLLKAIARFEAHRD
jgi:hypothetical protein